LLFQSDAELAGDTLNKIMAGHAASGAQVKGMSLMATLFGDGFDLTACGKMLSAVSVPTLAALVRRAYDLFLPMAIAKRAAHIRRRCVTMRNEREGRSSTRCY
jgi:hypothetical protein